MERQNENNPRTLHVAIPSTSRGIFSKNHIKKYSLLGHNSRYAYGIEGVNSYSEAN